MDRVELCETFLSLQGESSQAGRVCFFIRLAGCNLRCRYCDTAYAREPGRRVAVAELVAEVRAAGASLCEITGGEPLLQAGFPALARRLAALPNLTVLVETNGSCDISVIPAGVTAVMDVKCPGSGADDSFDERNLARLRPGDEVKFVLSDRADYEWATRFIAKHGLTSVCHALFFSPVWPALDPKQLAEWMVRDRSPARLHCQLHRLWGVR
jgi:7-carboxy-7-deazaguanine synthase